ncbi:OmpA family protein [Hydrogenophaga pseudoflava]|uniref:OmpA family protein n=1 Tax=Hydrogenophaga pseudoflava TaxID=47421 RepID=UPI0027E43886|nr:OmpA family protein [Hydrogenophaga pseudoflava]MDQ7747392.1 OmpA family protein [Hydrogenophaga pseudoflava]
MKITSPHPSRSALCTAAFGTLMLVAGCNNLQKQTATPTPVAEPSPPAVTNPAAPPALTVQSPPPPPPAQPYDMAVLSAATALFTNAKLPPAGTPALPKYPLVIDPLIDGMTGAQSVTTRSMGRRLAELMRERYQQFDVQAFSAANVARSPLVLIGTFTGVNAERKTAGARETYRICFALADLRSGKLVSKGLAFALPEGVDPTPLAFFRDAPAWTEDPATEGYIKTCQGTKAGDPINPLYLDRILAASVVAEGIEAYEAGRYREALELYTSALDMPAGDQFRVHNGIYLANWKLGRKQPAEAAFSKVVDYGLVHQRLAVKFLFRPGSMAFMANAPLSSNYSSWLNTIALRTRSSGKCLEVIGHTSPTGPEPLNERLSLIRAEYIKARLAQASPGLDKRMIANGVGSKQSMVGNGRDDASDALDRRVEFKVMTCG